MALELKGEQKLPVSQAELWRLLEPQWGPARDVRAHQPLMVTDPLPVISPGASTLPPTAMLKVPTVSVSPTLTRRCRALALAVRVGLRPEPSRVALGSITTLDAPGTALFFQFPAVNQSVLTSPSHTASYLGSVPGPGRAPSAGWQASSRRMPLGSKK